MEIKQEQKEIIEGILSKFVFKIRSSHILNIVFTYYVSDMSQQLESNRVRIKVCYEHIKLQIQRKILSKDNNYWGFKDSEIKVVEECVNNKEFDSLFKSYVEQLIASDINVQIQKMEEEEKQEKNEEEERLKKILFPKEELLLKPVQHIINNNREFGCKLDKIKAMLSLMLNTDQIFTILSGYEPWFSQRSYVEKFRQERINQISEGKIKVYSQEEAARAILQR